MKSSPHCNLYYCYPFMFFWMAFFIMRAVSAGFQREWYYTLLIGTVINTALWLMPSAHFSTFVPSSLNSKSAQWSLASNPFKSLVTNRMFLLSASLVSHPAITTIGWQCFGSAIFRLAFHIILEELAITVVVLFILIIYSNTVVVIICGFYNISHIANMFLPSFFR